MSRIDDLLSQMTLDEKISMLAGADLWHSVPVPRLGIPQFKTTDGPNGARGAWGNMGPESVATPVGIALGATWNPDLVQKVGNVLADELEAKGAHILLAPTVNIHRTPIAGRNFECYSEDPFLSGMLASAYIKGIQERGRGACIKHFVANDQEFERFSMSSEVDERPLREIYLEPFRIAIRNSKPWAVMSAYNRVNGTYACEYDHTLKDILKDEWKFDGIVMSDWFGTYDEAVPAGGLDLEMPGEPPLDRTVRQPSAEAGPAVPGQNGTSGRRAKLWWMNDVPGLRAPLVGGAIDLTHARVQTREHTVSAARLRQREQRADANGEDASPCGDTLSSAAGNAQPGKRTRPGPVSHSVQILNAQRSLRQQRTRHRQQELGMPLPGELFVCDKSAIAPQRNRAPGGGCFEGENVQRWDWIRSSAARRDTRAGMRCIVADLPWASASGSRACATAATGGT